jgi:hypothetical protein
MIIIINNIVITIIGIIINIIVIIPCEDKLMLFSDSAYLPQEV